MRVVTWMLVIGVLILAVTFVSWVSFPSWRQHPGGILVLIGAAASGVIGIVKGVLDIVKEVQELKKNRLTDEAPAIAFANLSVEHTNPHWRKSSEPGIPYLFNTLSNHHFCLSVFNSNIEPSFDITVLNNVSHPTLITAIGVKIVEVADILEERGGGPPVAVKVSRGEAYVVEMPDLRAREILTELRLIDNRVCRTSTIKLNEVILTQIPDPIYLEPGAPFRYALYLKGYREYIPNNAILQLCIQTNHQYLRQLWGSGKG